jgi:hypothetical protein
MIRLLAGGSICLMADDFYAGSRPASSVRILVKLSIRRVKRMNMSANRPSETYVTSRNHFTLARK